MKRIYRIVLAALILLCAQIRLSYATSGNPKILKSKGHFDYYQDIGNPPDGKYEPGTDIHLGSGTWYTVDAGDMASDVKQMFYNDGWGEWCDTDPFGHGWGWVYGP